MEPKKGIIEIAILWAQMKELWQEQSELDLEIEKVRKMYNISSEEMGRAERLACEIGKHRESTTPDTPRHSRTKLI